MPQRVLVVEDEPAIADNIKYALSTEGFEVVWCSTGEEAVTVLEDDGVSRDMRLVNALEDVENLASEQDMPFDLDTMRLAATEARGVPVVLNGGPLETVSARARVIENTVVLDPDLPTLAEVREILDAPIEDPAVDDTNPDETDAADDVGVANE